MHRESPTTQGNLFGAVGKALPEGVEREFWDIEMHRSFIDDAMRIGKRQA